MSIFSDNLRGYRVNYSMTQAELGAKAGIHPVSIQRYEAGVITPGLDIAVRLARALGITLDALAGTCPLEETIELRTWTPDRFKDLRRFPDDADRTVAGGENELDRMRTQWHCMLDAIEEALRLLGRPEVT